MDIVEATVEETPQEEAERLHSAECDEYREELRTAITAGLTALRTAEHALRALCSDRLYDVEYAEGPWTAGDVREHLAAAARSLRAADAVNRTIA